MLPGMGGSEKREIRTTFVRRQTEVTVCIGPGNGRETLSSRRPYPWGGFLRYSINERFDRWFQEGDLT